MNLRRESHLRSMVKSILWRILGVIILALITFIFTRNLITTSLITFLHHFVFIWVYYLHERLWNKPKYVHVGKIIDFSFLLKIKLSGKKRRIARIILYELILGQGILGIISLIITGSLQIMTLITITYIWNKLWIYPIYDALWDGIKIKWCGIKWGTNDRDERKI